MSATCVLAVAVLGPLGMGLSIYDLALPMMALVGRPLSVQMHMVLMALILMWVLGRSFGSGMNGFCVFWRFVMVKPLTRLGVVAFLN